MSASIATTPRRFSRVSGLGVYRPERVVTNDEICEKIESSDEWIRERSGIIERRHADADTTIIDVPGLQVFGLSHLSDEQILLAFPEFRPHLGDCRFRDCRHDQDPGCALQATVNAGSATSARLALLRKLLNDNQ